MPQVALEARVRDVSARGRGYDEYALVGLPGTGRLVWADQVPGVEVRRDTYPRQRSGRAEDRQGSKVVRVPLPEGAVIVWVRKYVDGRPTERFAVRVVEGAGERTPDGQAVRASTLPAVPVSARRAADGTWVTVVDGEEWR